MTGPFSSSPAPGAPRRRGEASSGVGRFTNVVRLRRVGSTNTVALDLAAEGAVEGLVVVADEQTAGRGRLGRTWVAAPDSSLLCSVLLCPDDAVHPEAGFLVTACVALAAREAAASCAGVACGLKWPNDLLVGGSKVAGILAERARGGGIVVGLGCNLARPSGGARPPGATSLEEASGAAPVSRDAFLHAFLVALERRYGPLAVAASPAEAAGARSVLLDEVRAASATLGSSVRVELPSGVAVVGRAAAIRDDGRLVVTRPGGDPLVVEAGDVVHLRHAGDGEAADPPEGRVP